jgi:serine/threonine protein kinase/tetratricopeptide (TPR) repeat protein
MASVPTDSLALTVARQVDEICSRFEVAWKAATTIEARPRVEEYLREIAEPARTVLVLELLRVEIHRRRRAGEEPRAADYQERFPTLERTLLDQALGTTPPAAQPKEGRGDNPLVVGYEILGVLGRGGMGIVYRARQVRLNRVVALKMILAGEHAGSEERERFLREAEAVAQLRHPHIIQVYEVGECPSGAGGPPVPYIALEYADGGSLAKYLGGNPQPAREAAQLVEMLARAVHHAHEHGIVHRDLKPANVLLVRCGVVSGEWSGGKLPTTHQPKITDFGLAKRLDVEGSHTQTGMVVGTPSYMAPEQAAGQPKAIGPAADIYGLGAILYELLTGRPPFKGETMLDTLEQVRGHEPVPPSRLQPHVPRDLETVCLKALTKEPGRRYATAAALANDLHRWLVGEPIQARPVSTWERGVKWARRRPTAAALAVVSALAVTVVVATLAVSNVRVSREKQLAESRGQEAQKNFEKALDAVEQMLLRVGQERLADVPQMEHVRRNLLEDALKFYQEFLEEKGGEPAVRLGTGRACRVVADVYEMLGRHDEADDHYRRAQDILERLAAEVPEPTYRQQLALVYLHRSRFLVKIGRLAEARTSSEQAQQMLEPLVAEAPDAGAYRAALARGLLARCNVLYRLGEGAEVLKTCDEAEAVLVRLCEEFPGVDDYQDQLATVHGQRADQLSRLGRFADALSPYQLALELMEQRVARSPGASSYRNRLAAISMSFANALLNTGGHSEAEKQLSRAQEVYAKLVADFPAVTAYVHQSSAAEHNLGTLFYRTGQYTRAADSFRRAIEIMAPLVAKQPHVPLSRRDLANSYMYLGITLDHAGQAAEAVKALEEACARYARLDEDFPETPEFEFQLSAAHHNRGEALFRNHQHQEAAAAFRRAEEVMVGLIKKKPAALGVLSRRDLANTRLMLGKTLTALGQAREATPVLHQALELWKELAAASPNDVQPRLKQALTWVELGNHVEGAKEARALVQLKPSIPTGCYQAACVLARCTTAARHDAALSEQQRQELADSYAELAMSMLRDAVKAGLKEAGVMASDDDLESLRPREDFKKLLLEVKAGMASGSGRDDR